MDDKSISIYEEITKYIKTNDIRFCDLFDHGIKNEPEWAPFLIDKKKLYPIILYIESREREKELVKRVEENANKIRKGKHWEH